jgi:hypothetical protein
MSATFHEQLNKIPLVLINCPEVLKWSSLALTFGDLIWPTSTSAADTSIHLQNKIMNVTLEVNHDERERQDVVTDERYPLRDYGTAYLVKFLTSPAIIPRSEAIWNGMLSITGGFALHGLSLY